MIFFDFVNKRLSKDVIKYFGFSENLFAPVRPVFSSHGGLLSSVAGQLKLKPGIPISYKAGDQPNNALSLNVLKPGEVAATAGTSGVIYGVSDQLTFDPQSRVNTFAHVNYSEKQKRLGVLLCINGTGRLYNWLKTLLGPSVSYTQMNERAMHTPSGSEGLRILPFGNGVERMLNNKPVGVHLHNIDLNVHGQGHIFRAAQEGIACAFRYGLDIMRGNGMNPTIIRAGKNNLFLSELFTQTFVDITGIPVELYKNDGSVGAALGAGIGAGIFTSPEQAFEHMHAIQMVQPSGQQLEAAYQDWKGILEQHLTN